MTGLDRAIKIIGNQRRLALALNVKPMSVSGWVHKYKGRVPSGRVQEIFQLTGVTPHELRPDLYPNTTDGLTSSAEATPARQGVSERVGESVRECAEAHCAVLTNAPPEIQEREALQAIAALVPFVPGHRVLILPREQ
ncbi:helix-turn-helix domain-containing protein [Salmonella enterica subsp. enterica serovar Telelkebir]|nr:hypothetical protein [Salmonella enterica subsp. enterica serovar Telelkebir]EBS3086702.1 hypothetical protein [Salmonella enterica subsp. enterica serovar Telelkebir]EEC6742714.1 helix-turn-helix domain-containing protein [Salmonella enterica subsp. enterica serovar Telelkebir]EHH3813341.1 helix-turn-helix domain-containing protein [Salmonella enterica subsp. enterica serovar Telelkebir]EHH3909204.1 helix-turn-helix domain-containing protein [Salmonella enterica subsp. enterica serovar Tele